MNANETIRLLVLNNSRTEVERLLSMLNNAGRPTRAQHVESGEALTKLLQEQSWDLMIAENSCSQLPPVDALRQIKRLNKDVPVILISDAEEMELAIVEGLKMGAADVVQLDQDQHLLLVIQRELDNRQQRQQRRRADFKLKEAERRSQQLLDSSRDAIAFVQDGMYLYANQSFAEYFGYDDRDDIECMPVIDMVAASDQDNLKQFLKDFTFKGEDAEHSQLTFQALRADGGQASCTVEISNASYDEETCIQFMIQARQADSEELQAEIQKIKEQDLVTGLFSRHYLAERLEKEVSRAVNEGATGTALYIEIDSFSERIQPQLGVAGSDLALADIANLLRQHVTDTDTLARFGDDSFMLLSPGQRTDDAMQRAEQIRQGLEQHIVDINGKTVQVTATLGVAVLNEASASGEEIIDQALKAVELYRRDHAGDGNGVSLFEPVVEQVADSEADMARAVQAALDNNRFQLMFQPIISLRGAEDELYEVLLRMQDEDGELISPNEFLSVADQIGAMGKIDRWVILEAIKSLSEHRSNGHKTRAMLNLSRHSLCDDTLVPWLKVAFQAAKLSPDAIIFQVDEAHVTGHLNAARDFFKALQEISCQSSISNFGCSLNPFKALEHVPSDYIKVHGSFTQDIQSKNESPETLSNLIKQLLEANKITVVPFVEHASVLSTLWQTGVHYIQGHYLQAPTESMNYDFNMEG